MIKDFFTILDPDLSQESSVDPMGVQGIWTYYGQAIFNEKITTIANDLRIFTFNVFHNHVLNQLYKEHSESIQQAKKSFKTWQTEYDVKAGILMFLEDLVTWIFYLEADQSEIEIEKLGILGLNKARRAESSGDENTLMISANKKSGLLKNQINLGMIGRYKGPMMNMDFFDRSLTYLPKTWEIVDRFMFKWKEAIELEKNIIKLITKHVFTSKKKDFPQFTIKELKASGLWRQISRGYLNCFGRRNLPRDIRVYWEDKLGLLNGAAKALFDQIGQTKDDVRIKHASVFMKAKRQLTKEPEELIKVENIIKIEPFLSHTEYLLRFVAQPSIKNLNDIRKEIENLREEIVRAGRFVIEEPSAKLVALRKVMLAESPLEDWIRIVLDYHGKVMELRGGSHWVSLQADGTFKHQFGGDLREDLNTVSKYLKADFWWHTYYLETLRSIHAGLN